MEQSKIIKPDAWIRRLEWLERWGYISAGLSFLLLGMINFAFAWYHFWFAFRSDILNAALHLTNELLFVIILLELFRTVINFLKSRVINLEPFLYVGIIAGTRRILTGGAQIANLETLPQDLFDRYVWDIGLNVVIVLGLILAVFLYNWKGRPREG